MGKLKTSHIVETGVWIALGVIFFAYSYEFDRPIEIYKFGATGWPRVIIVLLFLTAIGNLYFHMRHGDSTQAGRIGVAAEDDGIKKVWSPSAFARTAAILLLPFVFAILLKSIGFYSLAPVFIALLIILLGEWRPLRVVLITLFIYVLLLMFFVVLLNANLPQGTVSPFYNFSHIILVWLG